MKNNFILFVFFLTSLQSLSFGQGSTYCGPYKRSSPLKLNSVHDKIIENLEIINSSGHCIKLTNCSNITIQNCKLGPAKNEGVYLYHCSNIIVKNCSMDSVDSGVVADSCTGIKITYNSVKNVLGPLPRGQMVQFGHIYGSDNCINYNVGENIAGQSFPEDEISLYKSNGTPNSPIQVVGNWIRGGGPSKSGGGIMAGDMGGSYILIQDNILVNPGQYGITISSGNHITITNNKIFGKSQPFSNVGLSVWNQYSSDCSENTIKHNEVNFRNKSGELNCFWNAKNCGNVSGWDTNYYNPNLRTSILPDKIIGKCK